MINEIVSFIATAVGAASELMLFIFEHTGTTELVISALIVSLIVRLLLGPITGFTHSPIFSFVSSFGNSDKAKKKSNSSNNKKES